MADGEPISDIHVALNRIIELRAARIGKPRTSLPADDLCRALKIQNGRPRLIESIVVGKIWEYEKKHNRCPSTKQLAVIMGVSKARAQQMYDRATKDGYVRRIGLANGTMEFSLLRHEEPFDAEKQFAEPREHHRWRPWPNGAH